MSTRIDTLRGFACLLLVLYHVIGTDGSNGLRLENGFLRSANDWLAVVRMPLFAFIAGWVYALRPVTPGALPGFLKKKALRLLVPMFSVGLLFLAAQELVPTNNEHSGLPFVTPVGHLWFVQALFLILIAVATLDAANLLLDRRQCIAAVVASFILYLLGPATHLFAVGGFVYLLPFFLLGMALQRFGANAPVPGSHLCALAAMLLVALFLLGEVRADTDRHSPAFLLCGVIACLLASVSGWRVDVLARLAPYTYAIFLLHPFFTAGMRNVLETFAQPSWLSLQIGMGVCAGVCGPILVQHALKSRRGLSAVLIGTRMPERQKGVTSLNA